MAKKSGGRVVDTGDGRIGTNGNVRGTAVVGSKGAQYPHLPPSESYPSGMKPRNTGGGTVSTSGPGRTHDFLPSGTKD